MKKAFEKWRNQGRTPEEIHGVVNFLTGAGGQVIKRHNKRIQELLDYCQDQNSMPMCKNCGLNPEEDLIEELK